MLIAERIQSFIHKLDVQGVRWTNYAALTLAVVALAFRYDVHSYHNFNSSEAMDAAQVSRNLAEGRGFSTDFVRPFSVFLVQQHNRAAAGDLTGTNAADYAKLRSPHPDLANAPLYPAVLAGFWKIHMPDWNVDVHNEFWSEGGRFLRYQPEFVIAIFNQLLLLTVVLMTFRLTKIIFDAPVAWLTAVLVLCSDVLWKFSVSGLPTLMLLVIFMGLIWCVVSFEAKGDNLSLRRRFLLAMAAGLLTALGMMTRYSFGWTIAPVVAYFAIFGGTRRVGLAVAAFLVFAAAAAPWVMRNLAVSGTWLGTAGYAVWENSPAFPGTQLMQSLSPNFLAAKFMWLTNWSFKLLQNLRTLLQDDLLHLGGGWIGILFLVGLLLGLRNTVARRLRFFTVMCLGIFLLISALGRTAVSETTNGINTENLLVLLTPLVVIFGVAFFLTLLNQINTPSLNARYAVVGLVAVVSCHPFALSLLPPRTQPVTFPPYYPPEIQRFDAWIEPNELIMSDIPWAVAWYGDRQCSWTTLNSGYEFFQFNDYFKPVNALYLTHDTLDGRLVSDCLHGGTQSWSHFVFERLAVDKIRSSPDETWGRFAFRTHAQNDTFPLQYSPSDLVTGLFLTDHQRWQTE
jgi:hypothetical protein